MHTRFSSHRVWKTAPSFLLASWIVWVGGPAGGGAALAQEDPAVIESGAYPNDAAAAAAWRPMGGTAPAQAGDFEGKPVLRLRCNFEGTPIERASWDRRVELDLSGCRGVQFEFYCPDASPVSYFSLYFQSGEGWYAGTFFPQTAGWNRILVSKSDMRVEGQPAGWGAIRTVRLSAWRGMNISTEFLIRDFRRVGVLGLDTTVALLRCDSVAQGNADEGRSAQDWCARVARQYEELGVECATLSDVDVKAETLRRARLLVLPYNPSMPEATVDAVLAHLQGGGRLLAFYGMPTRLRPIAGIEAGPWVRPERPGEFATMRFVPGALPGAPAVARQGSWNIREPKAVPGTSRVVATWYDDQGRSTRRAAVVASSNCVEMSHVLLDDDAPNKRRMLLAMTGYLVPEIWRQMAEAGLAKVGQVGGYLDFEQAEAGIRGMVETNSPALGLLAEARRWKTEAEAAQRAGRFPEACERATRAGGRMLEAFCAAQRPAPNEFRAFWCHSAFGVPGLDWDRAIRRLVENGFTAILPNMLWGGVAFYPSEVLPVAPQVASRGDQVAKCLAACRKHGLQIHVWKVNWNLGAAPDAFVERMRQEKRLQTDIEGREERWLCPSHPDNRRLEVDSMVELVRNYKLDGIHFDYIRYPGSDHCFCAPCRERFEEALGRPLQKWPQDVLRGGAQRKAWLDWRRGNITAVVQSVSEQARAVNPALRLSAAVFRNWPADRDAVGQDWKLWCENGYLDFVCPMDYTGSDSQFEGWVKNQKVWAGSTPCYPGIGAWELTPDRVVGQIQITRRLETGGFVLFNYEGGAARELVPLLGRGTTRRDGPPSR